MYHVRTQARHGMPAADKLLPSRGAQLKRRRSVATSGVAMLGMPRLNRAYPNLLTVTVLSPVGHGGISRGGAGRVVGSAPAVEGLEDNRQMESEE